ncbi:hypothetical protein [Desulfobacula toluolica]|nr:hypothetical protein [Desulfobacula toluolica]
MNDQSIEFGKIKDDSTLPEIVRKSFRVPVKDSQNVWVKIHNKKYPVLDICLDSIGIVLEDKSAFTIDQILKSCELNIFDLKIKDLNGRIVHFSLSPSKHWHCGIKWMDIKQKIADQISKIVAKMKEQVLKDDTILFD